MIVAVIAIVFLAITTATWAGVTGPGTTGAEPTVPEPTPTSTAPALVPEAPETPPSTTEVPEPPPFDKAARDLGDRGAKPAPKAGRQERPAARKGKGSGSAGAHWKAAKKAAKAECKRRYTGRARGQCISAAAREHKNPKARGHR